MINIKIEKNKFDTIIQEELQRYQRIKELESDKSEIENGIKKIEEATSQEEIDEIWGGLSKIFQKGKQAAGQKISNAGSYAAAGLKGLGQDFVDTYDMSKKAVNNVAGKIKQTYQQGEKEQAIKDAKKQIQNLWAKRQQIQAQLANVQNKYLELTGKKLGNQFQAKPKPTQGTTPQSKVAAE